MKSKLFFCLALILSGSSIVSHADETGAISTNPEVVMIMGLGANGATNLQMVALEGTNSLRGFTEAAVTNWEHFILSSTNVIPTNAAGALPVLAAMMKTNIASMMTNSLLPEVFDAAKFLAELKKQGRLPGVTKDSPGQVMTGNMPAPGWSQKPAYPLAVILNFAPTNESFVNCYTVVRFARGAPWQLVKASQTDIHDRTVKELPVHWIPDLRFIRSKARTGDVTAEADLGTMYLKGEGVKRDYGKAVKWLRRAAEQGDLKSEYNLGLCYYKGEGVPRDYSKAMIWFRKAATANSARAMFNLGTMYLRGEGVPQDYTNALTWLRKAADAGVPGAYDDIAKMYVRGAGVPTNTNETIKWLRKAAERGSAWAQTQLGIRYGKGDGVESNVVEAAKWYQMAAKRGYPWAETDLASMYFNGRGVTTNLEEAVKLYRLAADQGVPLAQRNLAICYILGEGVTKDPVEAYKWLTLAAEQGAPKAASYRNTLSRLMSPEAIAEGFRRAQAFVPHPKAFPDEPQESP